MLSTPQAAYAAVCAPVSVLSVQFMPGKQADGIPNPIFTEQTPKAVIIQLINIETLTDSLKRRVSE